MDQIQHELSTLIEAKTGVQPQPQDTLDVLMIDSLAMAELTVEIEKAFGIRIGEDVLEVHQYHQLVDYVRREGGRQPKGMIPTRAPSCLTVKSCSTGPCGLWQQPHTPLTGTVSLYRFGGLCVLGPIVSAVR